MAMRPPSVRCGWLSASHTTHWQHNIVSTLPIIGVVSSGVRNVVSNGTKREFTGISAAVHPRCLPPRTEESGRWVPSGRLGRHRRPAQCWMKPMTTPCRPSPSRCAARRGPLVGAGPAVRLAGTGIGWPLCAPSVFVVRWPSSWPAAAQAQESPASDRRAPRFEGGSWPGVRRSGGDGQGGGQGPPRYLSLRNA